MGTGKIMGEKRYLSYGERYVRYGEERGMGGKGGKGGGREVLLRTPNKTYYSILTFRFNEQQLNLCLSSYLLLSLSLSSFTPVSLTSSLF